MRMARSFALTLARWVSLALSLAACASDPAPTAMTATAEAALVAGTRQLALVAAQTAQAQAEAIAQTATAQRATETASADATATAAVQSATQQAVITATAVASALYPAVNEIFRDEFVDNHNLWFTGVFQEVETDLIEDGRFKVRWSGKGTSYELWDSRELSDFAAEVECQVVTGGINGSCALVFTQANEVGFYKFEVFANYYRLAVIADGAEPLILAEGRPDAAFDVSQPFRLRVVRRASRIIAALDGQTLATIDDDTFLSGKVGISTSSYSVAGGVEVQFDTFVIWELK